MGADEIRKIIEKLKTKKIAMNGKDFLLTWEKTRDELEATFLVADALRALRDAGISPRLWDSGIAVSNFRDNSTRTRFSFASACDLLGLYVQDLDEGKSQIAHGETVRETANMISFLSEAIGIRDDMYLGEGDKYQREVGVALDQGVAAGVLPSRPTVVNLQSDIDHPTQSMADFLHLSHYYGGLDKLKGKKIAMSWAYSPSYGKPLSVPQGIIGLASRLGMEIVLAHPEGYGLIPEVALLAGKQAAASGGSFKVVHSMEAAFEGADIVYPKSWAPYDVMQKRVPLLHAGDQAGLKELEKACLANNARFKDWECDEAKMKLTRGGKALYMHCLPADITDVSCPAGEVAASVFERYRDDTYREASYKPYVIAAMILLGKAADPAATLENLQTRDGAVLALTLLVVDDDETQIGLMRTVCAALEYPKVQFLSALNVAGGLRIANENVIDMVITDLHLPDGSGFDVLAGVKAMNPTIAVVVMTAYADAGEAVNLLKSGAEDYLVKPTAKAGIERVILRINERTALQHEALLPPNEGPAASPAAAGIIYRSEVMAGVLSMAARAATSSATVLIAGESGTGKELVARFIHERSGRTGPFVAVNVSALPETLAESELFGHSRGSFTGATADRAGRFEEAEGGTLFLDEISETSLALQVKLLRALQFGQIERVGENVTRNLDVRIITATNQNLARRAEEGSFRRDFYYRLNVIQITLPPLRERKEDIRYLVDHFIARYAGREGKKVVGITREAMDDLIRRRFMGNVRELENIIERAVVLCRGDFIRSEDVPAEQTQGESENGADSLDLGPGAGYQATMFQVEKKLIFGALVRAKGNQSAAARELGISERHFRSCLKRLEAGPDEGGSTEWSDNSTF